MVFMLLVAAVCCFLPRAFAEDMYCGAQNCYDLIGISRLDDPSVGDVKKVYRKLARLLHPDSFRADALATLAASGSLPNALKQLSTLPSTKSEAVKAFRRIAAAYEVLSDKDRRSAYDYYLDHPEQRMYNQYAYYKATYAAKTNPYYVVFGFLSALSAFHWYARMSRFKTAVKYFTNYDRDFQIRVKRLAAERLAEAAPKSSGGKKGNRKQNRALLETFEAEVKAELTKSLVIEGGYKKPTWRDIIAVQLLFAPYRTGAYFWWNISWYYRFSIKGEAFGAEEEEWLTARSLRISLGQLQSMDADKKKELMDRRLWEEGAMEEYIQHQKDEMKRKKPNLYKRYIRATR